MEASSAIWLLGLSAISIALFIATLRCTHHVKLAPFWVFIGMYFATTFVGSVCIGVFGLNHFESIKDRINIGVLYDIGSAKYWCILFGPFIVPVACMLAVHLNKRSVATPRVVRRTTPAVSMVAFSVVAAAFGGYALFELYRHGYLYAVNFWQSEQGDFHTLMTYRGNMKANLGHAFFIITYSVLPTLCSYALYEAIQLRSFAWKFAVLTIFVVDAFLIASTLQKSFILINLLVLGVGLISLRAIPLRGFAIFAGVSFVLLTLMQTYMMDNWRPIDSMNHLIYRMASAYPFYMNVYPTRVPHEGIYLGLNVIGIGQPSQISGTVIRYMYTNLGDQMAHAPAAAHIDAYAQGGVVYSYVILGVIGVLFAKICTSDLAARGPIAFAIYIQTIVFAYYLTQASFVTVFIGSYGVAWSFVGLAPLWAMQKLVTKYGRRPQFSQRRPMVTPRRRLRA